MIWIPLGLCLLILALIAIGVLIGPDDRPRT